MTFRADIIAIHNKKKEQQYNAEVATYLAELEPYGDKVIKLHQSMLALDKISKLIAGSSVVEEKINLMVEFLFDYESFIELQNFYQNNANKINELVGILPTHALSVEKISLIKAAVDYLTINENYNQLALILKARAAAYAMAVKNLSNIDKLCREIISAWHKVKQFNEVNFYLDIIKIDAILDDINELTVQLESIHTQVKNLAVFAIRDNFDSLFEQIFNDLDYCFNQIIAHKANPLTHQDFTNIIAPIYKKVSLIKDSILLFANQITQKETEYAEYAESKYLIPSEIFVEIILQATDTLGDFIKSLPREILNGITEFDWKIYIDHYSRKQNGLRLGNNDLFGYIKKLPKALKKSIGLTQWHSIFGYFVDGLDKSNRNLGANNTTDFVNGIVDCLSPKFLELITIKQWTAIINYFINRVTKDTGKPVNFIDFVQTLAAIIDKTTPSLWLAVISKFFKDLNADNCKFWHQFCVMANEWGLTEKWQAQQTESALACALYAWTTDNINYVDYDVLGIISGYFDEDGDELSAAALRNEISKCELVSNYGVPIWLVKSLHKTLFVRSRISEDDSEFDRFAQGKDKDGFSYYPALTFANFSGADFSHCTFVTPLNTYNYSCTLYNHRAGRRYFERCNSTAFTGSNLRKVSFTGAQLTLAGFNCAYMDEVNISDSDMFRVNLRKAYINVTLNNTVLIGSDLSDANIVCLNAKPNSLAEANYTGANIQDLNLIQLIKTNKIEEATFSEAKLGYHIIKEVNFKCDALVNDIQDFSCIYRSKTSVLVKEEEKEKFLKNLKESKQSFLMQLKAASLTLTDISKITVAINAPIHFIRLDKSQLFSKRGDTYSYQQAILILAKKFIELTKGKAVLSEQESETLHFLANEMLSLKPYRHIRFYTNKEWYTTLDELNVLIHRTKPTMQVNNNNQIPLNTRTLTNA